MIIEIAPGDRVRVPTNRDFRVRTATSFEVGELVGVVPVLQYQDYLGGTGQITGSISGTDFIFPITAGLFSPGECTVNFLAVVAGQALGWPEPVTLDFEDPLKACNAI